MRVAFNSMSRVMGGVSFRRPSQPVSGHCLRSVDQGFLHTFGSWSSLVPYFRKIVRCDSVYERIAPKFYFGCGTSYTCDGGKPGTSVLCSTTNNLDRVLVTDLNCRFFGNFDGKHLPAKFFFHDLQLYIHS